MPSFKAPSYSKKPNTTGVLEPCYTFTVNFSQEDDKLSFTAEDISEISLKKLQECIIDNLDWWKSFVGNFILASAKYYAKPYTFDTINKTMKHTLSSSNNSHTLEHSVMDYPAVAVLYPKDIVFSQNIFTVNWSYDIEKMLISVSDLEEEQEQVQLKQEQQKEQQEKRQEVQQPQQVLNANTFPDSETSLNNSIQELNIDEIPDDKESTDMELNIENPSRYYDKQRVKEARLRAKLALYKAERHMTQYYDKYGSDISDSDSSDYETSDNDSDEEA